ncbi:hypothetical protein [uncultured Tateyamaria sp.]|uniref:hypothetical protein n=1 Tax=uncultured Tateyamaria sp. TaxID=455651 RepID=UPI0026261015|nr:hypothetical protein [uncultured Tateyamaria sp.]
MKEYQLTDTVLGPAKLAIYNAFEEALDARRVGRKADTKKWFVKVITEVDGLGVYDDKKMAAFTLLAKNFLKKHGYFSYSAAFKKRKAELAKLTSIFKKKGGPAAKKASETLHSSMMRSGEIPAGTAFADCEDHLTKLYKDIPKFSNANEKAVNAVKWPGVMREFALPKGAEKDLKELGASILKNGAVNKKTITMAKAILADAGNTDKTGIELVMAVSDKVVTELM